MIVITISEKPQKDFKNNFGYKKEELNIRIHGSPQNHDIVNKKQTLNNLKLVKDIKTEIDLIQKQRDEKRWRNSLGYYYLNPEKFRFGLKDL